MHSALVGLSALMILAGGAVQACSIDTPCTVGERDYYIAMPDAADGPVPSVVFLHGAGGSGNGALRNSGMVNSYLARGYAVIAPDGVVREGRNGKGWYFYPASGRQQEEVDNLEAVRDDAVARFDLDPDHLILTGFSIGGSMVAYAACLSPDSFSAYSPVGGNFWRPHPEACEGPVRMLHTHGWTDGTVPLEGRAFDGQPINTPGIFAQGDVFEAMAIWRATNGCNFGKADRFIVDENFWRRAWDRCTQGSALELALFPRGHGIPNGWANLVMDWYEGL